MAEVTYYFYWCSTSQWTDPNKSVDNDLETFAYTSTDGASHRVDSNTCTGTDLGTITKIEIRLYGYGDGNDRIDCNCWTGGAVYQITMSSSANWSSYFDVTNDIKAPLPWTWSGIDSLAVRCIKETVAKGNVVYLAKVEIKVTYTPLGGGYYHGLKVQGVGELALCDVGTHPLRIRKGGTTYGIELVATDDPNASALRIKTGAGIKAVRKYT